MLTPPQHLRGIGGIMMEGSALAPILRLESESKNVFFANFALAKAKMSLESASLRQQVACCCCCSWMRRSALVGRISALGSCCAAWRQGRLAGCFAHFVVAVCGKRLATASSA